METKKEQEPDLETMPLTDLMKLYEEKVEAFKKRNKNVQYLINPSDAGDLNQKAQGRLARKRMLDTAQSDITKLGEIVRRRLAAAASNLEQA